MTRISRCPSALFHENNRCARVKHGTQSVVQRVSGDRRESVSLSVIVPDLPSQSIGDVQKAALRRAMEILQSALLHPK
jgi:hypothetical protein